MGSVVHLRFSRGFRRQVFSADVYCNNRKKYQFQIEAASITEAYFAMVAEAVSRGVRLIRCIAIYIGRVRDRSEYQVPAKICKPQINSKSVGVMPNAKVRANGRI